MDWSNSFVTNGGIALLGRIKKGVGISAVWAEAGTGLYPEDTVREKTTLLNKKQDIAIIEELNEDGGKSIHLRIDNRSLTAGYKMQQVGIWMVLDGENEDPVLFSIQQDDTGVDIPSKDEIAEFVLDFYVLLRYSNSSVFHVEFSPQALVTMQQLMQFKSQIPNILVGPASMVEQIGSYGMLIVTDDGNPEDYFVGLDRLLAEGYKSAIGEADDLDTLLTVGRANILNLRADKAGTPFGEDNIADLVHLFRELCAAAVADGTYVAEEQINLTWRQVEYYILHGELVSDAVARGESWPWSNDTLSEITLLRQEVNDLRNSIGETVEIMVDIAEWQGEEAPWYAVLDNAVLGDRNGIVGVSECANEEQRAAAADALIHLARLEDGQRVLEADGKKPEIAIPITIIVF